MQLFVCDDDWFQRGLTHSTEVHCLSTAQKASHMWWAGCRSALVFSQAPLKLYKLLRAALSDLLDHWAVRANSSNVGLDYLSQWVCVWILGSHGWEWVHWCFLPYCDDVHCATFIFSSWHFSCHVDGCEATHDPYSSISLWQYFAVISIAACLHGQKTM